MLSVDKIKPEDVGLSSERLARVSVWMRAQVERRKLAGLSVLVQRRGRIAFFDAAGMADAERASPMRRDTIVRIYSMTKPITSVAIMMLYEQGLFQLDDPISTYIPAFAQMRVLRPGASDVADTMPAERGITFRDLLSHTSGLTYGFLEDSPLAALYREKKIDFGRGEDTLAAHVEKAAALPLVCQPGTGWNYSISTDVLGRLVEVLSGEPLDAFVEAHIFGPLGMTDTGFFVAQAKRDRFAACYGPSSTTGFRLLDDPTTSPFLKLKAGYSGGGGLCSTLDDYARFCQMMLNKGELEGRRLLGRKTVELMTSNHLGGDMASMGMPRFSESSYYGIGFGLGFSVMLDPARAQIIGTPGEYAWGGLASTAFWIDPAEDMAVTMLTQLIPSSTYPIRRELRALTYAAVVD